MTVHELLHRDKYKIKFKTLSPPHLKKRYYACGPYCLMTMGGFGGYGVPHVKCRVWDQNSSFYLFS